MGAKHGFRDAADLVVPVCGLLVSNGGDEDEVGILFRP